MAQPLATEAIEMSHHFRGRVTMLMAFGLCAMSSGAVDLRGQTVLLEPPDAVARVQFTHLVSMRELSDGSLLLSDRGVNRLFHYDWTTGRAVEVGTRGRGPREFEFVGRLYSAGPDSTLFTDSRRPRWNLLVDDTIVSTLSENRRLNQLLGWKLGDADHHGHVLGVIGFRFSGHRRSADAADSLLLLLAEWETEGLDTIARLKGSGQSGFVRLPATGRRPTTIVGGNPLDSEELGLLFSDGAVAVARLDPYRIDWRRPTGTWLRGDPLPFEARGVTDDVRCAAMEGFVPNMGRRCEPDLLPGWPRTVPPFLRWLTIPVLLASPEGHLVVFRTAVGNLGSRRYDIINRAGRLAGVFELPADQYVLGFGSDAVYTIQTDELGRQTLRRHRWN